MIVSALCGKIIFIRLCVTLKPLLMVLLIFVGNIVLAQMDNKEQDVRKMMEEATVFDGNRELLSADTNRLLEVVSICEKYGLQDDLVRAYRLIGLDYFKYADYINAIKYFQLGLKGSDKLSDSFDEKFLLELSVSNSYFKLGRLNEAEGLLLKQLEKLEASNRDSLVLQDYKHKTLINLGNVYINRGQFSEAITTMQKAAVLINRDNFKNDTDFENAKKEMNINLATIYVFKGDAPIAKSFLLESLEYLQRENKDFKVLAQVYGNLAYCEFLMGNYEEAYDVYFKSLKVSKQYNYPDVTVVTYKDLSDTYFKDGKTEEGVLYLNKYYALKDSIQGVKIQQNIDDKIIAYETEKKEQEIIRLNQENKIVNQQRWLLIGALALALILAAFLITYFRNQSEIRKRKTQVQSLELKNLNQELKFKEQDLTRMALEISNKQDLAKRLLRLVGSLKREVKIKGIPKWKELESLIQNQFASTEEQKIFHENIASINHAFFDKLSKEFPNLSKSERELCSYLKLGLSNKEIAALRGVSLEAVRSGRFRLRKKLGLESKEDTEVFLQRL